MSKVLRSKPVTARGKQLLLGQLQMQTNANAALIWKLHFELRKVSSDPNKALVFLTFHEVAFLEGLVYIKIM